MDARIYQAKAARTLVSKHDFDISDPEIMLIWTTIGLVGEAGEVAEHIKKGIFHQHGLDPEKLKKELGDVLWYIAAICETAGFDMGTIMQDNIDKLQVRYPNGYRSEDSKLRVDTQPVSATIQREDGGCAICGGPTHARVCITCSKGEDLDIDYDGLKRNVDAMIDRAKAEEADGEE